MKWSVLAYETHAAIEDLPHPPFRRRLTPTWVGARSFRVACTYLL